MPDNSTLQTDEKPVFTWKAAETASYKKDTLWFVLISLAALALIAFFVWDKNWTAAGVIAAAAFALMSFSRSTSRKITCDLYRSGVVIDGKTYRYADLKSFWMIYGQHPAARFSKPGRLSMHINMPIAEEDPEQIRLFLSKYLPEEADKGEDISDVLTRWFKL
ncbi:MAG: hypothetical protein BWY19_00002 [bacterium ADurb.Bin212]|nr:MAG: hypothetical protein BWY19_00002 [bacterium ADurb.Bin212]